MKYNTVGCLLIIVATLFSKLWALAFSSPLIAVNHNLFNVRFGVVIAFALTVEWLTLMVFAKYGEKAFLKTCSILGTLFIFYHLGTELLGYHSPCACLGGLFHNEVFGKLESQISLFLAFCLFVLGVGSFKPKKVEEAFEGSQG